MVKRYKDTEWGCTVRTVHGGARVFKSAVVWKKVDGQWREMLAQIPPEISRWAKGFEERNRP